MNRDRGLETLGLGLLVGLYEATCMLPWDWLMQDASPARVGVALLWTLAILVVNAALWGGLGLWVPRLPLVALYLGGVGLARWWVDDRFELRSLGVIPVALLLAWKGGWRARGLLAVALALLGLWGRAPGLHVPLDDKLAFLGTMAVMPVFLGAVAFRPFLGLAAVAYVPLLFGLGFMRPVPPPAQGPNLLFVLVDTLRRDHLEPWRPELSTPSLARLAREGRVYEDAITVIPKTTPSVASIFTGRYPPGHGVRVLTDRLRARERTMAELLRERGYATAAFVHNGWISPGRGFEQGFDQFWSWFELARPYGPLRLTGWVTALDALTLRRIGRFDGNTDATVAFEAAQEWISETRRPFFAYIHLFDPHWPYRPPGATEDTQVNDPEAAGISRGAMIFRNPLPEAENTAARRLYSGEIAHSADAFAGLLDMLDQSGLSEETIVVFTADHGHHLGDHGYWYHHGDMLYEPGLDIPLVIRWPGQVPAGERVSGQVRSIDLMPTLLGMMGVPLEIEGGIDGVDLAKAEPGPAFLESDTSFFGTNPRRYVAGVTGKVRGVRDGRFKLIYTPKKGPGVWELYDLVADPEELHDLVAAGEAPPALLLAMMKEMAEHIPAEERAKLEALGNRFDALPAGMDLGGAPEAGGEGTTSLEGMSEADQELLRSLGYVE